MNRPIKIIHRQKAKHIISRLLGNGTVQVTLPTGVNAVSVMDEITRLAAQLGSTVPAEHTPLFYDTQEMKCGATSIFIMSQSASPHEIVAWQNCGRIMVGVGTDFKFGELSTDVSISRLLKRVATHIARHEMFPRAIAIARHLGVVPAGWKIGRGLNVLGTCDYNRVITLSSAVMFLPLHLRDYVICHELAHLSEMNHSKRFHKICNDYCQGRERELAKELKTYKWPIIR